MQPVQLNIAELRKKRQSDTNTQLVHALCSKNKERVKLLSNVKELDRYLSELNISLDDVLNKCEAEPDLLFAKTLARCIAKNASRQGDLDETEQIRVCNDASSACGITVSKLKKDEYRAMKKTPQIITVPDKKKMKRVDCSECLKSFDARISGEKDGWMFLKAVYGSGGHQDSVFREAREMCDWAKTHKRFWICVVIDTDQTSKLEKLKNDYSDVEPSFLFIGTSYDFQTLWCVGKTSV